MAEDRGELVKSFLMQLSKDPQRRREFRKDPDGVMRRAGLSKEDREAIKSGDPDRIRAAMGEESAVFFVIVYLDE